VVHKSAQLYARQHDVAPRVLLIGAGQLALRYYENVIAAQKGIKYIGYLAPQPADSLPGYLGTEQTLAKVLSKQHVDQIVAAQDVQSATQMRRLAALAESYRIRLSVVPIYSDFLYSHAEESSDSGLYTVD